MAFRVKVNARGACGTCESRGVACDEALPVCHVCQQAGLLCTGYAVRIQWPQHLLEGAPDPFARAVPPLPTPVCFSALGLSPSEDRLMLHFTKNVARFALAVDYHGNGYRKFAALALHEPVVLNSMLAVARSHLSRWQGTVDTDSRVYLRRAVTQLQQRFRTPSLVKSETTLVTMLMLLTYEVFSGSPKWKHHYDAISGWVQAFSATLDLDPFLKTWITLMDTQSGLNRGVATIPQVSGWTSEQQQQHNAIDPLLGCSVNLPHLMVEAAQLYQSSIAQTSLIASDDLKRHIGSLQARIRACKITQIDHDMPLFAVTCNQRQEAVTAMDEFAQYDLVRSAIATAEIFRHATHIYVHRIENDPTEALDPDMQQSLEAAFALLPHVPNAMGPGANLGWALVVIGSEIDTEERREYLRCRWKSLQVLGIGNVEVGARLLEDVWCKRDLARTFNERKPRWQDVMRNSGTEHILI